MRFSGVFLLVELAVLTILDGIRNGQYTHITKTCIMPLVVSERRLYGPILYARNDYSQWVFCFFFFFLEEKITLQGG